MLKLAEEVLDKVFEDVLQMRRHLHAHPEISGEEFQTSAYIQKKLTEYGIKFEAGYAKTGVLGIIEGGRPGGTVAIRADIDALPILEKNNDEYISKFPGKMHACGHDAHTAMLLGAGRVINEIKEQLSGKVLLVFQPAEEDGPIGGAKPMMDDGVFNNNPPDVIFAQHVWPNLSVGQVGIREGVMMGNSDRFSITIKGAGGHASMPHQAIDAIVAASQMVNALQSIISRNVDPIDCVVLTVGKMGGGYRYNVIAEKVTLEGTIRTFKEKTKMMAKKRFFEIVENTAKAMGIEVEIEYLDGYPSTINTPKWAAHVRSTTRTLFGEESLPEITPSLCGEDFSRFLEKYPGAFIWLGTQVENEEEQKPLHDPKFKINEKALPLGVKLLVHTVVNALEELAEKKSAN
ncbi:M20 metallopeptidase family protein [Aneurinibacillus sp. REN35]|uniref:M20 metallopeptidase family protein n=1 Tax=Aneurinibacillus sp. REN35 TaxID=3237286 RepID=UPI0035275E9E